tara:strand:+ start:152 stop:538 length:387 start_codon:yes stop_codon:yes gene_type:complete
MSTIKVGTLLAADGSTTTQPSIPALDQRMATSWVNFRGTGTVTIRDSYNVSSLTDGATGDYIVNFATNMANTNYCPLFSTGDAATVIASGRGQETYNQLSNCRTAFRNGDSQAWYDPDLCCLAILGGQ